MRPTGISEERTYDFFISRTGIDSSWAQWVAWQLEEAGYSTRLQDWDFAGMNFAVAMNDAVARSKRTLVLLSRAFEEAAFTQSEWTAAFRRDPRGEDGILVVARVENYEPQGLLASYDRIDLFGVSAEEAARLLLDRVRAVVSGGRLKPTSEPSFPGAAVLHREIPEFPGATGAEASSRDWPSPQAWVVNRLPIDTARFADREREREDLRAFLLDEEIRLVRVLGRPGIGKSALVGRVLNDLTPDVHEPAVGMTGVDGILYLNDRSTGLSLEDVYSEIKTMLDQPSARNLTDYWSRQDVTVQQRVEALLDSLRRGRYLIVLDGMESALRDDGSLAEQGLRTFVDVCMRDRHAPHLTVTSRTDLTIPPETFSVVRAVELKQGLPTEGAVTLLRALDPQGNLGLRDAPARDLRRAAQLTGGNPRALELIAGILYRDQASSLKELLSDERSLAGRTVENVVAEAYRWLDDDERHIMHAMAVFDKPVSETAIAFFVRRSSADIDVSSCLRRLTASYFVTVSRDRGEYSLQPLDRDHAYHDIPKCGPVERGDVEPEESLPYCQESLESVAADYYASIRKEPGEWRSITDLAPQIAEIGHRVRAREFDRALAVLEPIDRDHLFLWGHYTKLIELRKSVLSEVVSPRLLAANYASLATCYQVIARYDDALRSYEHAVATARQSGDKDAETNYIGDMGRLYRNLGYIDRAIDFSQQALDAALESRDRWSEGVWSDRLALAFGSIGRLEDAIRLHKRAISIAQEVGHRRSEGAARCNLGLIFQTQGRDDLAERSFSKSLDIAREIRDRRGEAIALGRLGTVAESEERFDEAFQLHEDAFAIARALGDRREQSYQLLGMGKALAIKGDLVAAEGRARAARDLNVPETSYLAGLTLGLILMRHTRAKEIAVAFDDASRRCRDRLDRCADLFATRYALATALVGLAISTESSDVDGERRVLLTPALDEYLHALAICRETGIVRSALRDLEGMAAASGLGLAPAMTLLKQAVKEGD